MESSRQGKEFSFNYAANFDCVRKNENTPESQTTHTSFKYIRHIRQKKKKLTTLNRQNLKKNEVPTKPTMYLTLSMLHFLTSVQQTRNQQQGTEGLQWFYVTLKEIFQI
jgi:hypothetical protein